MFLTKGKSGGDSVGKRLSPLSFVSANCQKAQLRIYDGYEHSLEDQAVLKKFCGDNRFYKVTASSATLYFHLPCILLRRLFVPSSGDKQA
jgi:hypothetical protein